jgi:selenocysteine lyase/cysteine desulfurase
MAIKSRLDYRSLYVGLEVEVPLLGGTHHKYVNIDNAASTPALKNVQRAVNNFLAFYSSVHRGTGFKSQLSTHYYEEARQVVMHFLGANPNEHTCIFGKNTTEAANKLARRFPFTSKRDIVLTTGMEHHSNDLPWRPITNNIHVALTPDGRLDETDFEEKLSLYSDRLALVAVTGASNVTGFINPIHRLAEKTHSAGGMIFVDCAQLAPHHKIDMRSLSDPSHLDFVAISAHKMYAPFGTGALVGRKDIFAAGEPDQRGGGTVEIVTLDDVIWTEPPDKDEAGSPNTVGAIALAAAILQLEQVGMENVAAHEAELTSHALSRLHTIPGLRIYGDTNPENSPYRLGVIPMEIEGISHFLVAAVLGFEFGIGVRSGCFCAHPYILHLLGLREDEARMVRQHMIAHDKSNMPGMVRASFGLYNTLEEVDYLVEALSCISQGNYHGQYKQTITTGEYKPAGWEPDFSKYFSLV